MGSVADMLAGMAQPASAPAPTATPSAPPDGPNPYDQIDPPKPRDGASTRARTAGEDLGMGTRALLTGAGGLVDIVGAPLNATVNAVTGSHLSTSPGRDLGNAASDAMGLATPQSDQEKFANAVIEGGAQGLATAGVAGAAAGAEGMAGHVARSLAAQPLVDAALSAESAGASEATRQHGGGTVAQLLAGMAAPTATALAVHAAPAAAGAVQRATDGALAGVSQGAAERAAGTRITNAATDPAAVRASLEQPGEIVPGSQPTTYQQTGDVGLGALDREAQTRSQPAYQTRAGEQNAARVEALTGVQQGADPNDVSATLRQHFEDLDAAHEAQVQAATQAAQQKAAQFGGTLPADQYGQVIRDAMESGRKGSSEHVSGFWDAIDPNKDLTGNLQETRLKMGQIAADVGPTSKPMTADEANIFQMAENLPDIGPANQLVELRKYINAVAREPAVRGTPTEARLTQARKAIDSNLANTISQQVANEAPAVARGDIAPSQSMLAKVQSWQDGFYANRTAALASGDGSGAAVSQGGATAAFGVHGAAGQGGELPSGTGGNPSVSGTPTFDEAARQRLIQANAESAAHHQVWSKGPIESILAKTSSGDFRVADGKVAQAFFHPGPDSFQHMQWALKASPDSLPAFVDYAATKLRQAALRDDGTLDPAKYAQWRNAYQDALRALPEDAKAKFADAASAGQTLAEAQAARTAAQKAAEKGALARVMNLTEPQDIERAIGSIMRGRTAVADIKQLLLATKGNPEARAGLRQAVVNEMTRTLIGNAEVGTSGVAAIKGNAYQTFIKDTKAVRNLIFSPEEVKAQDAIAEDLQRSARSANSKPTGTPGTAHDVLAGLKRAGGHGSKSMLDIVGGVIGHHFGGEAGLAAGIGAAELIKGFQAKGVTRVNELVDEAMLNPALARELLKKAPPKLSSAAFKPVMRALVIGARTRPNSGQQ